MTEERGQGEPGGEGRAVAHQGRKHGRGGSREDRGTVERGKGGGWQTGRGVDKGGSSHIEQPYLGGSRGGWAVIQASTVWAGASSMRVGANLYHSSWLTPGRRSSGRALSASPLCIRYSTTASQSCTSPISRPCRPRSDPLKACRQACTSLQLCKMTFPHQLWGEVARLCPQPCLAYHSHN